MFPTYKGANNFKSLPNSQNSSGTYSMTCLSNRRLGDLHQAFIKEVESANLPGLDQALAASGADSICPPEHNLLILEPPEIIAEYGGSPVIVNCTTALNEHDGMYWTVGNEIFQMEDEELFVSHSVPVSDWNVKPKCKIKLHESLECSKDLEVIVFKAPEMVSVTELDNAQTARGTAYKNYPHTQHKLQCDIINVAPVQYLTVSWYKSNERIHTQFFNDTTTKTPVNESSILKINISREENVAEFRCEAGLDFGPQGPKLYVNSQTHRVSAHYAPEKNTKNSTQDIFLLEGTNITLSCEAVGNPPPVYNWTCDGKNMLENTNSLNITRVKHHATCTCTATNYLGNITHTINVHVKKRAGCPLTLTPSETVVTFGDPVSVSCSTSATDVEGMGWEAPFGGTGFEPPPVVTWRVEKLEEWTPSPFCYATLVDGSQCTVSPVITVYKIPDTVSIYPMNQSQMMEKHVHYNKHTRTQYWLQCDSINVAPVQFLTVNWYKNNESIMAMSFNDTTTKTPVNESSILKVNISREENVAEFRCEAELDFGPHGPKLYVGSQTHNVSAHYAPELKTQISTDVTYALEGTNITLSCEAIGNPPPVYNWTCDGENMLENTNSLNITRVNRNKTCTCTATNYLGNITKTIHLHVEPRGCPLKVNPSEIVVTFGDPVSVNCSTSARYVTGMGWEAPFGGTGFKPPPVVTWRVDKLEEWTPSPFCYATLADGSRCTSHPVIIVYKTPDFVSVPDMARGPMVEGIGISTQRDYNGLIFRCEAELHLRPKGPKFPPNVTSPPYTAVVLYKPLMKACPDHVTVVENAAFSIDMLPCQPDGNPPPTVQWFYEEKLINASKSLTRTDSGKYTAVVENSLGRSNTSVHITVELSPSFTCKEHYEVTVNDKPQSICEPVGLPTPTLTWFKDGQQVVSPQRWKKNDSGKYLLNAHNTHGTAEHTLYLEILYAPEFKGGNESKEVLQGEDVTLSCSADSNPPSNIRWIYTAAVNSKETTEGHQKIISITKATSTNGGYYICVAENKAGRNTRFVRLVIKGKTIKIPLPIIWVLLALLIIGLIVLVVCCHNQRKKRGHYNFVPDEMAQTSL
ncbi:hemicentin-1-like isoform X2 [Oreochromis aureus]|uniref:hemicentin-1-like isoform X2 n=1 Tax=Oreochromis aureus TaxID=47969 RepID=UPI001954D65B|nr:hemicentin-1-like isoform X2 [Oreochromis aureus]